MIESVEIPKFQNETEEADWLYANRERLTAAFLQAAQEGRVRHETLKQRGTSHPTTE